MSYHLYEATIQIIGNGAVRTKLAYSLTKEDGSKFLAMEKSKNHNYRYGTLHGEMITSHDGNLMRKVERANKNGVYGIWRLIKNTVSA